MKFNFNNKATAKIVVISVFILAIFLMMLIPNIKVYKDCKGLAIISNNYYNVYTVTKKTDTNYQYYYKSIKVRETSNAYYTIMVDWYGEKTKDVFNKNQYIVVIQY